MTNHRSRFAAFLLAFVAFFGVVTATAEASPISNEPVSIEPVSIEQNACGDLAGFTRAALSSLPKEATDTYKLIQTNGPFPYPKNDGVVFQNREKILPACASSYYHEYTVITPGSSTRGARRIITGDGGEYFYTGDHYASFKVITV
ncbi:Guanyl-specific ribonuclease Sa [Amycolatopsis xylanica]|uniref:Guanyl-specific ribonuclease Sa n=1 Tax=Amycolatopsis xylanica TaxID=589385 RepID=A0A1H3CFZ5_9PSEU|nr:Guanyl-specific ribonuclease Sa [Amycolatopsis xylanica]